MSDTQNDRETYVTDNAVALLAERDAKIERQADAIRRLEASRVSLRQELKRRGESDIRYALFEVFSSPNVMDTNMETANVVDVLQRVANASMSIANAITPLDAAPYRGGDGEVVASLTEAALSVAQAIKEVAGALRYFAEVHEETARDG